MYPNIIVTAANSQYFNSLRQLIYSFYSTNEYKQSQMVCYDIGLGSQELDSLEQFIKKIGVPVEIRKFEFAVYPDIVRLEHKTYSWKPIIINEVLTEKKCNLLWMDSADIILRLLSDIWVNLDKNGQYLPLSGSGTIRRWTHPTTLKLLNVPIEWQMMRNRAGSLCGFSYQNDHVREMVNKWAEWAEHWVYIKPKGSNRRNHRDDQSLMSILACEFAEKELIELTDDEVDISSGRPIPSVSVRNKLNFALPLSLLAISIAYFKARRMFDVTTNHIMTVFN
jgi:hypothetical protein